MFALIAIVKNLCDWDHKEKVCSHCGEPLGIITSYYAGPNFPGDPICEIVGGVHKS